MAAGGGGGSGMQLQVEQNLDLAAVKERQQALSELESDIVDVNQIFKDLARIVHDQGELVGEHPFGVG
jgi:t-SNARE complex subunit (syntaxin)